MNENRQGSSKYANIMERGKIIETIQRESYMRQIKFKCKVFFFVY